MGQTESDFLKAEGIPEKPKLVEVNLHPTGRAIQILKTRTLIPSWADSYNKEYGDPNDSGMENRRAELLSPSVMKVMHRKDKAEKRVSKVKGGIW